MKIQAVGAAIAASVLVSATAQADDIRIAHVVGKTGLMEYYSQQLSTGLAMGLEYATKGSNEVLGRKATIITKDTQLRPERARAMLAEAYGDDDAHVAVGDISSGAVLAMLPVAAEYERILIPSGVADSITGADWNRYVFRVARNSTQDSAANAVTAAEPGACIATLAQDYAFGRDGIAAYVKAAKELGAKIVHEEYAAMAATDFSATAQRLFDALNGAKDCKTKYVYTYWAGKGAPMSRVNDLQPERYGIKLIAGGNILPMLVGYKDFPGLEGAVYYYYEHPKNSVNDWLVKEHFKRFNSPPDFFTAQGMSEAMAIVAGIQKAGSTDTEELIAAMEGMTYDSPKGKVTFRKEDHQTMQPMYQFRIAAEERSNWFPDGRSLTVGVPHLVREIPAADINVPIMNKQ